MRKGIENEVEAGKDRQTDRQRASAGEQSGIHVERRGRGRGERENGVRD